MMNLSVEPNIYYNDILNLVREFFYEHYLSVSFYNPKTFITVKIDEVRQCITLFYKDFEQECTHVDSFSEEDVFKEGEKKHQKNSIKRCLIRLLTRIKKEELPWGILTGVRPVKIVHKLLDAGHSMTEIQSQLRSYLISEANIDRMINIALLQRRSIYPLNKKKISLYVHIPFCPSRCVYCSFHTMVLSKNRELVKKYLEVLRHEMRVVSESMPEMTIDTVYIGGGTPTTLSAQELENLFISISEFFDLSTVREWTVEAGRPDSIHLDQLLLMKKWNVSRVSINPQTMNEDTLCKINRKHGIDDIYKAFKMVRDIGFNSINADLIIGLQDERPNDFRNTLTHIASLDPDNLTIHTLSLKRGAQYKNSYILNQISEIHQMVEDSKVFCRDMKLNPYYLYRQKDILGNMENIGYSKTGYECIYNMLMMEEKQTVLAFGMGAISKFFDPENGSLKRVANFKNMKEYIDRIEEETLKKSEAFDQLFGEGFTCMKK